MMEVSKWFEFEAAHSLPHHAESFRNQVIGAMPHHHPAVREFVRPSRQRFAWRTDIVPSVGDDHS
jgi:hypothetical protein